jgi:hypothetical protein
MPAREHVAPMTMMGETAEKGVGGRRKLAKPVRATRLVRRRT